MKASPLCPLDLCAGNFLGHEFSAEFWRTQRTARAVGVFPLGGSISVFSSLREEGLVELSHENKLLRAGGSSHARQFRGVSEGNACLAGTPAGRFRPGY